MYNDASGKLTSLTKTISICFCVLTFNIVFCSYSYSATYYVCDNGSTCGSGWSTGSDSFSGTSKATPKKSISAGISAMSGGDTLIIGNGTYTTRLQNPPSGSAVAYTTVRAENDWGVTIDGSGWANSYNSGINISNRSYVLVRGIKVKMSQSNNTNLPVVVSGQWVSGTPPTTPTHHVKLIRIGASYGPAYDNASTFNIMQSTDVLVEECYAFAGCRYQFQAFWCERVIFRRNVARVDYYYGGIPNAAHFQNYDSKDTVWQNNIAIDTPASNAISSGSGLSCLYGGFFFENKNETFVGSAVDTSQVLYGNIILNVGNALYGSGIWDEKISGTHEFYNNIIWGGMSGLSILSIETSGVATSGKVPTAIINNMTAGALTGTYNAMNGYEAGGTGVGIRDQFNIAVTNTVRNSVFWNNHSYGVAGPLLNSDYNAFYGNGTAATNGASVGANSITTTNPATNGLRYLPRIEPGSTLKTAGVGGAQIGAEVMYQMGTSGTLYGEPGWNTLTSTPLWPFPNEAVIKSEFASYSGPGAPGARGFATGTSMDGSPQTLTKYIWEYLGNQIPSDIYGSSPPVNGVCGTNNGGTFSSLTSGDANNCSSGTVTNFTGTGPWAWYCAGSNGGTNSSTCSASLAAGDTTPPSVSISTSTPQSITADLLNVTGSSSDASGVTVCKYRIGAAPNASNGTACTGTTSWNCSTTGYTSGSNTLFVGCTDSTGNWPASTPSITVNYTPQTTTPATSCTYYVRPDGHDAASGVDNTNNASTGAWLTLQHASNSVVPGDTVCVADGTYAGFFVETSGVSSNPITFRALGTGANITSRNSRTADNINIESWTGTPADYITIDGFNVYNATRMGIRVIGGTGVIIKNNIVHNNTDQGIFSGWTPSIQVLYNTSYSNGSANTQHNIYLSNATTDNPIVKGNIVYSSNYGNGIQLNGDWLEGEDGFIDNALIEDNIIYNSVGKGLSLISVRYATIRNNITYGNHGAGGIHIVDQQSSHYSINNTVVNNTLDETATACVRINALNTGNVVFNNICLGSTGIVFEGSGNYQSNNSTSTTGFVNRAGHDYHLIAGSPAIDTGLATYRSVTPPSVDFTGTARPQGAGYDIGAYEKIVPTGYITPTGLDFELISPEDL